MLVAKLDRMLPDDARRGGFKGAGPRSAGIWGRSLFNVLSDTIEHLKGLGPRSATEAPMSLPAMGLSYFDIVTSRTAVGWEIPARRANVDVATQNPSQHPPALLPHPGCTVTPPPPC